MDARTLMLNGKRAKKKEISALVAALTDLSVLESRGGYLFKASTAGDDFLFGILPALVNGERTHHYDIELPGAPEHVLIGAVSATGIFTLLFKTPSPLEEAERGFWADQYIGFARFFLEAGYDGPGEIDWITQKIIEEAGLWAPVPVSLQELAGLEN